MNYIPLINGIQPSWANLEVIIAGVRLTGITKISYSDKQTMENIYGIGQYPVGRGYGNIEPSCSITMLRSTAEDVRSMSPTGRMQDIPPFDIIVAFVPPDDSNAVIEHRIRNCQFKDDSMDISQGDTREAPSFELLPSHIEWA